MPQPWQPQPIPPTYVELQAEYDNYQNIVQRSGGRAAAGHQRGADQPRVPARRRRDQAVRQGRWRTSATTPPPDPRDPKSVSPAAKAKDGILAIYQAQNNFDAIQATNNKFIQLGCGDKAAIDLAINQNRSLNFSRAADLYKKQQYIPAAQAFYRFYKNAPQTDPDLPTALYNAAVAYKLGDKPKTAIGLFKEFTAKPDKRFQREPVLPRRDAPHRGVATGRVPVRRRDQDVPRPLRHDEARQEARHQAARSDPRRAAAHARSDRPRRRSTTPRTPPRSAATSSAPSISTAST